MKKAFHFKKPNKFSGVLKGRRSECELTALGVIAPLRDRVADLIGLTAHVLAAPHVSLHDIQVFGGRMGHSLSTPQRSKFCFSIAKARTEQGE